MSVEPERSAAAPAACVLRLQAWVDPEKLCVTHATERIAVPERGVEIGNFDATMISRDKAWITVAGTVKTGAAQLTRIRWSKTE